MKEVEVFGVKMRKSTNDFDVWTRVQCEITAFGTSFQLIATIGRQSAILGVWVESPLCVLDKIPPGWHERPLECDSRHSKPMIVLEYPSDLGSSDANSNLTVRVES